MKFVISRSSVQVRPPAPSQSTTYSDEQVWSDRPVSHPVSHSGRDVYSALPIALILLTLLALLSWQGFHYVQAVVEHAEHAMAGPWG
jgi:sterol desaturase/sphingolipid hydroxylase (fatty acid hydroxylase superfamily)